mgnify:CR=1 FL=1
MKLKFLFVLILIIFVKIVKHAIFFYILYFKKISINYNLHNHIALFFVI